MSYNLFTDDSKQVIEIVSETYKKNCSIINLSDVHRTQKKGERRNCDQIQTITNKIQLS